jgi:hypothetical protein
LSSGPVDAKSDLEVKVKFDLFLKIRAKNLSDIRDIIEKKNHRLPNVLETELMTVLKTSKDVRQMLDKSPSFGIGIGMELYSMCYIQYSINYWLCDIRTISYTQE